MAQDPAAVSPSPTANILYAHHHDSDTEELNGWMNTHVVDPTGNDIALGPSAPEAQPIPDRVYAFTLAPALTAPITLDPSGNIVIDAYIGAGGSQGAVRVSTAITYGGETVAEGAAQNLPYEAAGDGPYELVTWTVAPDITEFAPGQDLVWTVTVSGVVATSVFMSVSPERGSSAITLPILTGPAPSTGGGSSNTTTETNSTTTSGPSSNSTSSSASSTSRSTTTTATSRSTTSSSTTGDNGTADEKDSPAPPLAFAGLAVLFAAVAIRRRLR